MAVSLGATRCSPPSLRQDDDRVQTTRWFRVFAVVVMAATVGCGADQVGPDQGFWYSADTPSWTVGDSAIVSVSTVVAPHDTIHLFGIQRAVFADNGDILVAIGSSAQQILALDTLGGLRWSAGRTGDGPGEFRAISDLVAAGDTTFVWDGARKSVAVFEVAAFKHEMTVAVRGGRRVIGIVDDSLVVAVPGITGSAPGTGRRYELWNVRSANVRGEEAATVEGFVEPQGNLATLAVTYEGGGHTVRTSLPACITGMQDVVVDDLVYVANTEGASGSVYLLDPVNGGRRLLYQTRARPIVAESLVEEIRGRFGRLSESASRPTRGPDGVELVRTNVRLAEDSVAAILGRIGSAGTPLATTWMDLIADETAKHLWLRRAACDDDGEQEWEVIDTEGRVVARAMLPGAMHVRDVRYPRILVTMVDSLGVERLAILSVNAG